jgi:hypothetical protein
MISNEDIKNISKYFNGEEVDTKVINTLNEKLKLIVRQIEVQEKFNEEMSKISEEFEKIKTGK